MRLNRGEPILASVVLFCASRSDGSVWEDTTQVDGETAETRVCTGGDDVDEAPTILSSGLQELLVVRVEVAEDDWAFTVFTGAKTRLMLTLGHPQRDHGSRTAPST